MFYRGFVIAIILFWVGMMGLLIRFECFPNRPDLLPVPVDYVWRLMFRHEQQSDLALFTQGRRMDGAFHLQPRILPEGTDGSAGPVELLNATGNFGLTLPGSPAQRVIFHGTMELDEKQNVRHLDFSASFHEPKQTTPTMSVVLDGVPAKGLWHYQVRLGTETIREGSGTPEALLDTPEIRAMGIDPHAIGQLAPAGSTVITAHRGVLHIKDEDVETYVVTVKVGGSLESTIHVNQLGQILAVKTFAGYDLYDEALTP